VAQVSRFAQIDKGTSRIEIHNRGPIRTASPIPRHPDAARITRAHKLRQQPAETPGACIARGSFFVAVKTLFYRCPDFAGACVAAATIALIHKKRGPAFELASRLESSYSLLNLLVIFQ
jgi:hypothetical protein